MLAEPAVHSLTHGFSHAAGTWVPGVRVSACLLCGLWCTCTSRGLVSASTIPLLRRSSQQFRDGPRYCNVKGRAPGGLYFSYEARRGGTQNTSKVAFEWHHARTMMPFQIPDMMQAPRRPNYAHPQLARSRTRRPTTVWVDPAMAAPPAPPGRSRTPERTHKVVLAPGRAALSTIDPNAQQGGSGLAGKLGTPTSKPITPSAVGPMTVAPPSSGGGTGCDGCTGGADAGP